MNNIEYVSKEFKKLRILNAAKDLDPDDLVELLGMLLEIAKLRCDIKPVELKK